MVTGAFKHETWGLNLTNKKHIKGGWTCVNISQPSGQSLVTGGCFRNPKNWRFPDTSMWGTKMYQVTRYSLQVVCKPQLSAIFLKWVGPVSTSQPWRSWTDWIPGTARVGKFQVRLSGDPWLLGWKQPPFRTITLFVAKYCHAWFPQVPMCFQITSLCKRVLFPIFKFFKKKRLSDDIPKLSPNHQFLEGHW